MPNYIQNKIELIGNDSAIKSLVDSFSTFYQRTPNKSHDGDIIYKNNNDEIGWLNESTGVFTQRGKDAVVGVPDGFEIDYEEEWTRFPDFNKVVPMPESLLITSGSLGEMAHELLFGNTKQKYFPIDNAEQQKRFAGMNIEMQKEAVDLAIKYQDNLNKYGHTTWYGWACENWGTKWNCSECEKKSDNVYEFQTAWSGVPDLICKISKKYPELKIIYKYASEDSGSCTGVLNIQNGDIQDSLKPESQSKEGYDIYFELHPDSINDYKLINGKYEYVEEVD